MLDFTNIFSETNPERGIGIGNFIGNLFALKRVGKLGFLMTGAKNKQC